MHILRIFIVIIFAKFTISEDDVVVTEMDISCFVMYRFTNTTIKITMMNVADGVREATFSELLPNAAEIMHFSMEIGKKNYTAFFEDEEKAKKSYKQDSTKSTNIEGMNSYKFTVSVEIGPKSEVVFYLTYVELLKKMEFYEIVLNIHPRQPVPYMRVNVFIKETQPINFVRAAPLRTGKEIGKPEGNLKPTVTIAKVDSRHAAVLFVPSKERQKELARFLGTEEKEGLSGQFVVEFGVQRNFSEEFLEDVDRAIHFFTPEKLKTLPKHYILVLDTSMDYTKTYRMEEVAISILKRFKKGEDFFSLVDFNKYVNVWNLEDVSKNVKFPEEEIPDGVYEKEYSPEGIEFPKATLAGVEMIKKAKKIVNNLLTSNGSNIYEALKLSRQLAKALPENKTRDSIQAAVILLSYGKPTVGVVDIKILEKGADKNSSNVPIFILSFGDDANKEFLWKLALENNGFIENVQETDNAAVKAKDFYERMTSLLFDNYLGKMENTTKSEYPYYLRGSEVVSLLEDKAKILAKDSASHVRISEQDIAKTHFNNLWNYLKKRSLTKKMKPEKSLVVTKPDGKYIVKIESAEPSADRLPSSTSFNLPNETFSLTNSSSSSLHVVDVPPSATISSLVTVSPPTPATTIPSRTGSLHYDLWIHYFSNATLTEHYLFKCLDWLNKIYNNTTETIKFSMGEYKLGSSSPVAVQSGFSPCHNGFKNATGNRCTHLLSCNGVEKNIPTLDDYLKHFCPIGNNYAGVCCPH